MNWNEAANLISNNIQVGSDVNTLNSTHRFVEEAPPFQCTRYDYGGAVGYQVKIGVHNSIEIPVSMLETLFNASLQNNGVYNNGIFEMYFPLQLNHHGCHVHVVGRIFEVSGVAIRDGNNYEIL